MNKSFRMIALLVTALIFTAGVAEAQSRIATVELTQIFEKYWKTKRARSALTDRKADLKKELDTMNDAHKKLVQDYQKLVADANDQAVSAEERAKRKKLVDSKLKEVKESEDALKQFVNMGDAQLDQQMRRMMDEVLKDIREAVTAKGKAGGYAFVFDASAESLSKAPIMMYNNGENDLTATVIDQLNATAPPEPAGAADSSSGKK